jgi:hypothetical protein
MPQLIFFVTDEADAHLRSRIRAAIGELADSRTWLVEPPYYFEIDEAIASTSTDGDAPLIGGALTLLPPNRDPDRSGDEALQLSEVEDLVSAVQTLSRDNSISFEFELDGVYVGAVDNGDRDACLEDGLLGEWRRQLGQQT